ncbi:hypothetical protein ACFSYH_07880 [Populibacterium corticicola]|uniref:Uncharacterized protein n=1 Tax=Populibacterium corticicola TaxID=1812826 RepID=A0ABW5XFH7_9MICO
MPLTAKVERIRVDESLTEQQRLWKAIATLAKHIDDGDSTDILSALFGN